MAVGGEESLDGNECLAGKRCVGELASLSSFLPMLEKLARLDLHSTELSMQGGEVLAIEDAS